VPVKPHIFKRAVLGLHARAPDRALQVAVKMADLLQLELLGLFIDDSSLHALANISFAREYHMLSGAWQPMDPRQLARDMELAARSADRALAEAAGRLGIRSRFEVIQGSAAETIASISGHDDIIIIIEPASLAERNTQQYAWLVDAAFRSAAAVMLMPTRTARSAGPVVAVAASPDDRSVAVAAAFAAAANENLIIIEQYEGAAPGAGAQMLAAGGEFAVKRLPVRSVPFSGVSGLSAALGPLQERLVVVSSGIVEQNVIETIVSAHRVPVLVIGPHASRSVESRQLPE